MSFVQLFFKRPSGAVDFNCLLDRQITGLVAFEKPASEDASLTIGATWPREEKSAAAAEGASPP